MESLKKERKRSQGMQLSTTRSKKNYKSTWTMKRVIQPKGKGTKSVNLKMKHNYLLKIFKIHQGFLDYQVTNSYLLRS